MIWTNQRAKYWLKFCLKCWRNRALNSKWNSYTKCTSTITIVSYIIYAPLGKVFSRLHVNFNISVIMIYLFLICFFWMRRKSVIRFGFPYPISLGHWICVHQGIISAAAGLEPATPGLWVNHATNELSWCQIGIVFASTVDQTMNHYPSKKKCCINDITNKVFIFAGIWHIWDTCSTKTIILCHTLHRWTQSSLGFLFADLGQTLLAE